MKYDSFHAIVDVQVIRDDVFAEDEPIAKALHADATKGLMVVLVSGGNQTRTVAGVGAQRFFLRKAGNIFV